MVAHGQGDADAVVEAHAVLRADMKFGAFQKSSDAAVGPCGTFAEFSVRFVVEFCTNVDARTLFELNAALIHGERAEHVLGRLFALFGRIAVRGEEGGGKIRIALEADLASSRESSLRKGQDIGLNEGDARNDDALDDVLI